MARSRPSLVTFRLEQCQVGLGWAVEALPEVREEGAVAGAVEGLIVGVPGHDALHVRAHRCHTKQAREQKATESMSDKDIAH